MRESGSEYGLFMTLVVMLTANLTTLSRVNCVLITLLASWTILAVGSGRPTHSGQKGCDGVGNGME